MVNPAMVHESYSEGVPLTRPFTRKEKVNIMDRFLLGTAIFNAVSVALILTLNVGGAQSSEGYILAEETYLFTWSLPYFTNKTSGDLGGFTFLFFMNSLCVTSNVTSSDHCLYHQVGMVFDVSRVMASTEAWLSEKFPEWGPVPDFVFGSEHDVVVAIVPFIFFIFGLLLLLASWVGHFVTEYWKTARKSKRRRYIVLLQFLSVLLYLIATAIINDRSSAARGQINPNDNALGPSFFAIAWCATAAQFLGAFCYVAADRVRRDLEKMDEWLATASVGRADGEYLPPYSQHDPLGRPPSIGRPVTVGSGRGSLAHPGSPTSPGGVFIGPGGAISPGAIGPGGFGGPGSSPRFNNSAFPMEGASRGPSAGGPAGAYGVRSSPTAGSNRSQGSHISYANSHRSHRYSTTGNDTGYYMYGSNRGDVSPTSPNAGESSRRGSSNINLVGGSSRVSREELALPSLGKDKEIEV